ncbi:MAG: type II toxin-antitoxin system VapC family toxin [Thermoanaerobaculia bacterium]
MILVDTSVLLPYLKGKETAAGALLDRLLSEEVEMALTPEIVQEVLQGARDEKEWRTLKRYLSSQRVVNLSDPLRSHVAAARIYYECRRRGFTVRSTLDCLVAQAALEQGVPLLHDDRDYEAIRRVRPLKTLP